MSRDNTKAIRLIEYLTRLASLRVKIVRDVAEYPQMLWIHEIPGEKGCFTQAWGRNEEYDRDIWIEVQTAPEPELPMVPDTCGDWVNWDTLRKTSDLPQLHEKITKQVENPAWEKGGDQPPFISWTFHLDQHPEVQEIWEKYVEQKWMSWAEQYERWEKVHRIYSSFFAVHQEQLKRGEEYELVLAMGLLTWQTPSNQRVRRHLVVANALLEFEARLGKFTVRPNPDGANLRPELDMLDIGEQPARAEESAKSNLGNAADDPWERDCVEGALKALVHSISPSGEYYPRLDPGKARISEKPIVEYAPALILRKRSVKGLTDVLKHIKDRIEQEGEIPPEFGDLAEIPKQEGQTLPEVEDDSKIRANSEIYFPKPSNEEQRRIVEKIRTASGVLVQGPPGTGKSHTIANLICHLLATGQRTLITAKTPRALQVLGRLLSEEIRPLCINLLGSGLEEKRSLEASVNTILQKNEQWNESREQTEIKKQEETLHSLRQEKVRIENRLRAIRESEAHAQTVADGAYCGTAAQIAQAVARDDGKYGWFTDRVFFEGGYPLADVDFDRLLAELRFLTAEKRQELGLAWPGSLESVGRFKNLVDMERKAAEQERSTATDLDERFLDRLSRLPREIVLSLLEQLEILLKEISRFKTMPHGWIREAIQDVLSGSDAIWSELHRVSEQIVESIADIARKADTTEATLPESFDQKIVLKDASVLKEHLATGGKLGWGPFRPKVVKSVRYILRSVRVDGRPCNDLECITELVDVLRVRVELERGWNFWVGRCERAEGPYSLQFSEFQSQSRSLGEVISLAERVGQCRQTLAQCGHVSEPVWYEESCLNALARTCTHVLAKMEMRNAGREIAQVESPVEALAAKVNAHPVTKDLLRAIRARSVDDYARAFSMIETLNHERETARWAEQMIQKVEQFAPRLAGDLSTNSRDSRWDERIRLLPEAWRWAQARTWLQEYINREDVQSLARRQHQLEEEIGKTIAHIASLRAWSFCFCRMREEHRRHMEAWRQAMRRLGKGTGKHASTHRREAQKHLTECREAVPAWVMPLHRVWDTVDPAPGMFDVIVVDEASQCGFEAFPLLYLGKKILIVGDDKQISPEAVGIPRDAVHRLMEEFLHDFNFKSSFDVDGSLFDQGKLRYGKRRITLREHFRCMPEIIHFSNDLCYSDTPLIPLRQYPPDRLTPLVHVYVPEGYREGSGGGVINRPEAEAIAEKVVEICRDSRYADKTVGVVVLQGDAQAGLIEEQLLERLGAEEMETRRLICGNPYSFQGDERDIILLSMVAASNERIGPLTMSADERRFNVAASRARDQMWLFHSVTRDNLSASCLRRRLIEFFEETKIIKIAGINVDDLSRQAEWANRSIEKPPAPFDSWFEVDVALEISGRNYRVIPQFEVAAKRIDLVVEGGHARLAVECDGDEFHGAEQHDQDMQRQRMLERCGWVFYRVRASAFYADRKRSLEGLWRMLEERGITPEYMSKTTHPEIPSESGRQEGYSADVPQSRPALRTKDAADQVMADSSRVEVGDIVVYIDEAHPDSEKQVQIVQGQSKPEWGTINVNTPIAQTLLGASVGQVVTAALPVGSKRLRITGIRKTVL